MVSIIRSFLSIFAIVLLLALPTRAQTTPLSSPPQENAPEATILVTTLEDELNTDGDCSLREAVVAANTNIAQDLCPAGNTPGTDTIEFDVSGTITLTSLGMEVIAGGPLVINGEGEVIISGGNNFRPFFIYYGAALTLQGLRLVNGYAWQGGAVYNLGTLTVQDSVLADNEADGDLAGGGAIYNDGVLTVNNSTLDGNIASSTSGYGGGIYNYNGTATVTNSTLSANQAAYGGGILSYNSMTITNSTLSGNAATVQGGGIYSTGWQMRIANGTLTGNHANTLGGGVYTDNKPLYLRNTILANNTATTDGPDCFVDTVSSSGYNLVGKSKGCGIYPRTGDLVGVEPGLGALQDNGGLTFTQAPLPGSLAINHGSRTGCTDYSGNPLNADQRGLSRFGRCDIGAVEYVPEMTSGPYAVHIPYAQKSCSSRYFYDNFSAPGWFVGEDQYGRFGYLNGEYQILAKVDPAWEGSLRSFLWSDYVLQVDVRNAAGVNGYYGFMFEFAPDWSEFFVFVINPYGQYVIFRWDASGPPWSADGYSGSIRTGTASNHLMLERNGSQIWAYANGELLTIFREGSFTEARHVGLITIADGAPVDARFDNFSVEPISCGESSRYPAFQADADELEAVDSAPVLDWDDIPQTMEFHK